MSSVIHVLDKGSVRLRDFMGSDLSVVNAARVSFDKSSDWYYIAEEEPDGTISNIEYSLKSRDKKLLHYLAKHGHKSPFAHAFLQFEVYAPMIVVRQWHKHRVGSSFLEEMPFDPTESWNESSRRYITENNEYYIPDEWRSAPENRKQGSGEPVSDELSDDLTFDLGFHVDQGDRWYNLAIAHGVAPEQARLFLPYAALYVRFMWSCSLLRVIEFLKLREADDAQSEIRSYAIAVRQLSEPLFPESFAAWLEKGSE